MRPLSHDVEQTAHTRSYLYEISTRTVFIAEACPRGLGQRLASVAGGAEQLEVAEAVVVVVVDVVDLAALPSAGPLP